MADLTPTRRNAAFLAGGGLALAGQVILLRELMVDVAGDELAVGVDLAAWLLGIAAGSAGGRRRQARRAASSAAPWGPRRASCRASA